MQARLARRTLLTTSDYAEPLPRPAALQRLLLLKPLAALPGCERRQSRQRAAASNKCERALEGLDPAHEKSVDADGSVGERSHANAAIEEDLKGARKAHS